MEISLGRIATPRGTCRSGSPRRGTRDLDIDSRLVKAVLYGSGRGRVLIARLAHPPFSCAPRRWPSARYTGHRRTKSRAWMPERPEPCQPQRCEREQTTQDARRRTASETARPTTAPSHQPQDARRTDLRNPQPRPRLPKQATDRQMMSPSQRPRSTETNRPASSQDETGAADANQQTRSQPIAPQAQRPPASQ